MSIGQGRTIFESHTEAGCLSVVDALDVRYLYLDTKVVQSAMDLSRPTRLVLEYTKSMMAFLIFQPAPQRILLLGLGGGSVAKFIMTHFPQAELTIVEQRQDVIDVARQYFYLSEHPRLSIINDDALFYLRRLEVDKKSLFDVVLVDIFDGHGMSHPMHDYEIYKYIRSAMSANGIAVFNLWSQNPSAFDAVFECMSVSYANNLLNLTVPDKGNIIVFATHKEWKKKEIMRQKERAHCLENQCDLPFIRYLRGFK